MQQTSLIRRAASAVVGLLAAVAMVGAAAQTPTVRKSVRPAAAKPAEAPPKGYRVAPVPAWVVAPPASTAAPPASSGASARRDLLVDWQVNHMLPKPQSFVRYRSMATDASTLGWVSQQQIGFNPAFQNITLHELSVTRDGRRTDRMKDARIETMRRERALERQVIDGSETLLIVIPEVRIGDAVEVAYTIEGENPIFEGRISETLQVGGDTPVDLLHQRLVAPVERVLQVRSLGSGAELVPERSVEGAQQVLRLVRHHLPAVLEEHGTPPWFKVYPAWQVSEYRNWAEVDAWAQRLFGAAQTPGPQVRAQVEAFRASGLQGEALVAEVLRFVQDEVRYFSVSLGESSHRPKPAERTLADRLGDCKDKVVLLNTLLGELGFAVKPALVSVFRHRGIATYLPSHDQFDHVITRLELDGKPWFLDATIAGQGLTLTERGRPEYGRALVVGAGDALAVVPDGPAALDQVDFVQAWDFSKPGAPARLKATLRAQGLAAEGWRSALAQAGLERIAEGLASPHVRALPGLARVGEAVVRDDRRANVFECTLEFEHADALGYAKGAMSTELSAVELFDFLVGPSDSNRRTPYQLNQHRVVTSRIDVLMPRRLPQSPPPTEIVDRHFRYSERVELAGERVAVLRRWERRSDEVLPRDLPRYRENVLRARQQLGNQLRMAIAEPRAGGPDVAQLERHLRRMAGARDDRLLRMLAEQYVLRSLDDDALRATVQGSRLAARIYASRAMAANSLGEFSAGLSDALSALKIDATLDDALEARGVALVGLGLLDEAASAFEALAAGARRAEAARWLGAIEVQRGRHAAAEAHLLEAVAQSGSDDRAFSLLWLYIAAEHQGRRGKAAIAPYIEAADGKQWSGAMLHFLDGRIDRDALLKRAREVPEMERLNLAEAYFYIGAQLAARGERDEALRWFERTVQTQAVPYREVTFAQLELKRAR